MKLFLVASILVLLCSISVFAQNEKSPCPAIKVIGGGMVQVNEPMNFSANLGDEAKNLKIEYQWTVSRGEISGGQGTSSIIVDTTGVPGASNITATVKIKGLPENCANTASETGSIAQEIILEPCDSYGKLPLYDELSRLDAFFVRLIDNPNYKGFIYITFEKKETFKQTLKRVKIIMTHVKFRKFPAERLVFAINKSENFKIHLTILWCLPEGTKYPACENCEVIQGKDL